MTNPGNNQTPPPNIPPFYRRTYLINPKQQLSIIFKVAGLVAFLLLVLNIGLAWMSSSSTREIIAANPNLAPIMKATDRSGSYVMAGMSVFLLLLVVIRTIVITHRTSGASFNIKRCLGRVAKGDLTTRLQLRPRDNLMELQEPFNQMMEALQNRASNDEQQLTALASKIEQYGHPEEAKILRDLAASRQSPTA